MVGEDFCKFDGVGMVKIKCIWRKVELEFVFGGRRVLGGLFSDVIN